MRTIAERMAYKPSSLVQPSTLAAATTGAHSTASTNGPASACSHALFALLGCVNRVKQTSRMSAAQVTWKHTSKASGHDAWEGVVVVGGYVSAVVQQVVRGLHVKALLHFRKRCICQVQQHRGSERGSTPGRWHGSDTVDRALSQLCQITCEGSYRILQQTN